ncbi:Fe-S-cluster containining protein [Desulfobaculum xiamenense]|uniref:Fe-S-cluster containining protein n=1 Tax=Desulfobaculum xiamenense TaxID=995050 RepID=A0A846QL33_9BACT|nr:zinc/iron-chelating domain-containing protein [Desulfobaculum xiamenense]NJB68888.1 Fe-S-cluster containining protein [Desulfobaculum xiamenense]
MQDPHVCARCAAQGTTCCKLTPGEEGNCFPLSEVERSRILAHCGDAGVFVVERNTGPFLLGLKRAFPGEERLIEELFPVREGATHHRLATLPDGSCKLLGPQGCTLPREVRPYYCRLFPFWAVGRRIMIFASARCLAQKETAALARLTEALGVTEAEIRRLHGCLRMAWGLSPRKGMPTVINRL